MNCHGMRHVEHIYIAMLWEDIWITMVWEHLYIALVWEDKWIALVLEHIPRSGADTSEPRRELITGRSTWRVLWCISVDKQHIKRQYWRKMLLIIREDAKKKGITEEHAVYLWSNVKRNCWKTCCLSWEEQLRQKEGVYSRNNAAYRVGGGWRRHCLLFHVCLSLREVLKKSEDMLFIGYDPRAK